MNKPFCLTLSISIASLLFLGPYSHPLNAAQLVDRVVAVVNDEVITMSEVNEEGKDYFKKINDEAAVHQVAEALSRAREEILESLIDKILFNQEAIKQGITVSDTEVQNAAAQILASNNIDQKTLMNQLAQMGMTYDAYLGSLHNQILQSKLVNYEIRSKIIITKDMILDYYDTHYTKQISGGGYYLMQMGFTWQDSRTPSTGPQIYAAKIDAKNRATRVRALVVAGQNFRNLAKKFSDLPSAPDGGDLGVFKKEDMAPYMEEAVVKLKPGETSQIIETPSGYQFFKLLSSQEGQIVVQASFASVQGEIRKKLYDDQLKKQLKQWLSGIKKQAYINKL